MTKQETVGGAERRGALGRAAYSWGVFTSVGHVLDNLEAPHDDVVDKVAPASQPIPASVTIEGTNNV